MGDQADDILTSFKLTEAQMTNYNTVKQRFEAHFVVRKNLIYERAKFNKRIQGEQESADDFINALHVLAEHCEYGPLHDDMIRDRIVVGLRDANLSRQLQMDADLTLKKAQDQAKQTENIKRQQQDIRNIPINKSIDALDFLRREHKTESRQVQRNRKSPRATKTMQSHVPDVERNRRIKESSALHETQRAISVLNLGTGLRFVEAKLSMR